MEHPNTLTRDGAVEAPRSYRAADLLDDLIERAGQPPTSLTATFHGSDPVFPATFPMAELGAASIGAAAAQAARLYELRTGVRQTVDVDLDAAAAAMRAWRYIQEVPARPDNGPHPVAFCRTADERWLFLHRMAPHHLDRILTVLGCTDDEAEIARAVASWEGAALEAAIMDAGACAALVRTSEEWAAHPQGRAVASLPLFRITRIGDSDPIPAGAGHRPLGGVRVLDLTRVLAGPTAARTLAEHGAHVLRIASPLYPDVAPMVRDTGHGKRSTVLDLRTTEGAGALRRLIEGADVFSQGYRPGAIARLGFSPEELATIRPGIISLSISAFGVVGPWGDSRGFDSVVQAASGVAEEMGGIFGRGVPRSLPGNPLDYITGYLAAFLVQVAMERRAREGGSYHIELSLAQTGRYLNDLPRVDAAAAAGRAPELPKARLDELLVERDTPYGMLKYLKPAARLSATPARWELPTVPVDNDRPQW